MEFEFPINCCIVVRSGQRSILVAQGTLILRVIASDPGNVSGKRRKPTAKKDATLAGHQLIHHAIIIGVQALDFIFEIIQEQNVIVFFQGSKKGLISLVRGDKNGRVRCQFRLGILINFFGRNPSRFELKISSANMKSRWVGKK